jgi:hypothetical protein
LKRRGEGKASSCRNLLLKMMMMKRRGEATLKKSLANTVVTAAAAAAVTLKKVLNARKLPQRLTLPTEIVEKLAL